MRKTATAVSETWDDYKQIFFSQNTITEETFHFAREIKFCGETGMQGGIASE